MLVGLFEMMFIVILGYVILDFHDPSFRYFNEETITEFHMMWIYVYFGIYILYYIRRLILISQQKCAKDPRIHQARFSFYTYLFISFPEYVWLIIGNSSVFWGDKGLMDQKVLLNLMLVIIIYSWVLIVLYTISLIGILLFTIGLYLYGMFDKEGQ